MGQGAANTMLKDPRITAYIQQRQREAEAEANLTRGKVIQGLLKEAEGPGSKAARVAAWTALARIIGAFTDNVKVGGNLGLDVRGQVHIYLPDNGRDKGA